MLYICTQITTNKSNDMDLTKNQLIEIDLLINASRDLILSSVEGVAQVAKRIQLYLECEFSEAVRVLSAFISEMQ